jgi:hypothetical protein
MPTGSRYLWVGLNRAFILDDPSGLVAGRDIRCRAFLRIELLTAPGEMRACKTMRWSWVELVSNGQVFGAEGVHYGTEWAECKPGRGAPQVRLQLLPASNIKEIHQYCPPIHTREGLGKPSCLT